MPGQPSHGKLGFAFTVGDDGAVRVSQPSAIQIWTLDVHPMQNIFNNFNDGRKQIPEGAIQAC